MTDIVAQAQAAVYEHWTSDTSEIAPRILNALMKHAPASKGAAWIAEAVVDCDGDKLRLKQLGDWYLNQLIVPMMVHGGSRSPLSHTSLEKGDKDADPLSTRDRKLDPERIKQNALRRDGQKCVICGSFDWNSLEAETTGIGEPTVGAHIIPFPVRPNDQTSVERSRILFNMLEKYADIDQKLIDGEGNNNVSNIITLSLGCHAMFGDLRCCLEPLDRAPDKYIFRKFYPPGPGPKDGTIITLTTADTTLPLANRRFLALHAACAKVAHASGATKYIEAVLKDRDEISVLAFDGSSADTLRKLLDMVPADSLQL